MVVQDFQNYTVARDTFLSHMGATLWGSLRHIVAPSLADGAFHYYEKISFQLFFITQEVKWCGQLTILEALRSCWNISLLVYPLQKTKHIKQLPLDLKSLMDGLSSLVSPSQKVLFSPHMYVHCSFVVLYVVKVIIWFPSFLWLTYNNTVLSSSMHLHVVN